MDRPMKPDGINSSSLLAPAALIEGRPGTSGGTPGGAPGIGAGMDMGEALKLLGGLATIARETLIIRSFLGPATAPEAPRAPQATAQRKPPSPPAFDASRFSTSRTEYKPALSNNHELIAALVEFHRANSPAAPSRAFGRTAAKAVEQITAASQPRQQGPGFAFSDIPAVDARPKPAPIPRRATPGAFPVLRSSKKSPESS